MDKKDVFKYIGGILIVISMIKVLYNIEFNNPYKHVMKWQEQLSDNHWINDSCMKDIYPLIMEMALEVDFEKVTIQELTEIYKKLELAEITEMGSGADTVVSIYNKYNLAKKINSPKYKYYVVDAKSKKKLSKIKLIKGNTMSIQYERHFGEVKDVMNLVVEESDFDNMDKLFNLVIAYTEDPQIATISDNVIKGISKGKTSLIIYANGKTKKIPIIIK